MRQVFYVAAALLGIATAQSIGPDAAPAVPVPFPSSCPGVPQPRFPFTLSPSWQLTKIAGGGAGMRLPRTIVFDPLDNMLVLQQTTGVSVHTFGADGCVNSSRTIISNRALNHGLALTPDGRTLYASGETAVYSWGYDAQARSVVAGSQRTVVARISNGVHSTRTLKVSPGNPSLLLVAVGSNSNWDYATSSASAGRSLVKVFDMSKAPAGGYVFNTDGHLLGYGMRNEVGLAFDPDGHVWGVENSGDDFRRTVNGQAVDIHKDNPAEELNYLGDPSVPNNNWYGYPTCFTAWDASVIQGGAGLKTGSQFVVTPNSTFNDATCAGRATPPRLSFPAHSAPIDAAFDGAGDNLYVTFHGSWDRQPATGYKLVQVPFARGGGGGGFEPVAPADSRTGFADVVAARDPGACQSQSLTRSSCWRPSAVAWDLSGTRLFLASDNDAEGEIFVLRKK
ncbi:hypothetical protein RB595_008901 [Gaeumannomyces hyphopodioides]